MAHSRHLQTVGLMPSERFVTTYSRDYKPFSERPPQVDQLKPRPEAEAAPTFINPAQIHQVSWPIFHQCFYNTHALPFCSLFPDSLYPFGVLAPSMYEASIASSLTEARKQKEGVVRECGPSLGEMENGHLHCVFGGNVNVMEQQRAKGERHRDADVLYEEGLFVSSYVGRTCCEDFLRSVYREVRLQPLFHLPAAKAAESRDNSLRSLGLASELKSSVFLQPASTQCCCCTWETVCPDSYWKTPAFPLCIPPSNKLQLDCTQPCRTPPLTEYQASYGAQWA